MQNNNENKFLLGVNYWPRTKAMYWWKHFEAEEVDDDFALLAEYGMDAVRIFLLWDDWQPEPDRVSHECMRNLERVCDLALKHGLKLDVTFFTGHMSGPNWAPGWLLDSKVTKYPSPHNLPIVSGGKSVTGMLYRNMFSDPVAISAAGFLLREVVGEFRQHDAIWLWNLGNEPDLFAWPRSAEQGKAWIESMTQTIRELDPEHLVTCGLHVESLQEDNGLRVHDVFSSADIAVMHGYPMYSAWSRDPLDPDFIPFLATLTRALSGKAVLMEEWGGCTAAPGSESYIETWECCGKKRSQYMASEEALAEYIKKVLPSLHRNGALGSMFWCFADYAPELWDKPPCNEFWHERFFGLVRPDGTIKPHAETIRSFAATNPMVVEPSEDTQSLSITPEEYYTNPESHIQALYQQYLQL